ncbi:sodium:solute symporter family transporter, partial [Mycolicibacterium frederiksbergense]
MIITGVAIFLLILTVSGVVSARRVRGDCSNYLVAGRALPAALVAAVLIAQPVDSNATIGNADLSAAFGFWAGAALPIGLALCLLLMGLFFAKRMRTADVVTLPEYFRNRFGRATEVASSYLTIASFIILLAGNLVAIGFLLERFVGVSYAYGILLTIPLALLYTITGGMFASVYTGVTCVIVNIIGVVSLVTWVGTTHGFSAPEGMGASDLAQLTSSESGAVINWATIIALGLGNLVAIDLMQRVFSARTPRGAQNACFAAAAGILMLCIPLSFVALAAVSI